MLHVHAIYICLSCLTAVSNDATLDVTGDDTNAINLEIEVKETPQGLAEWTPDDVFWTSMLR